MKILGQKNQQLVDQYEVSKALSKHLKEEVGVDPKMSLGAEEEIERRALQKIKAMP